MVSDHVCSCIPDFDVTVFLAFISATLDTTRMRFYLFSNGMEPRDTLQQLNISDRQAKKASCDRNRIVYALPYASSGYFHPKIDVTTSCDIPFIMMTKATDDRGTLSYTPPSISNPLLASLYRSNSLDESIPAARSTCLQERPTTHQLS